jgi:hypothetical protein
VRDFVVALVVLSVYHVLVAERYRSPNFVAQAPNHLGANAKMLQRPATDANEYINPNTMKARRIRHPKGPPPTLLQNHSCMKRAGSWAPIVLEEHKLLFFDVPKVGSTGFKQLFLRMRGSDLWKERNNDQLHWKSAKHLRTLSNYTIAEAQVMMTSPDWTRAMFVRDPKERLLSAFLDKVERNRGVYAGRACCKRYHYVREKGEKKWGASKREIQCMYEVFTFEGFLHLAATECKDEPHWRAQSLRVDDIFWPYMNFVGYMDNIAEDTKTLLKSLGPGVWEKFGASGWGRSGNEAIFESLGNAHHHSIGGALSHYHDYFTPAIEQEADGWLAEEYGHTVLQLPHVKRTYSTSISRDRKRPLDTRLYM